MDMKTAFYVEDAPGALSGRRNIFGKDKQFLAFPVVILPEITNFAA